MSVASAEQSKAAGNAAFKTRDYELALSHYSTAIALDPSVSTYPLNRSLVHLKLNHFEKADKDATKAIDLDGGVNMKAYFRRGLARKGLVKFNLAKKDFEEAIKQGAGQDVKAELDQLEAAAITSPNVSSSSSTPVATPAPAASLTPSKSDRLRAAISSSSSTPPVSTSSESSVSIPAVKGNESKEEGFFGMKAVSTRKLKPQNQSQVPTASTSTTSTPTSTPASAPSSATSSSSSFAAKKLSRQNRQTSSSSSSSSLPASFSPPPPQSSLPPPVPPTSSSPPPQSPDPLLPSSASKPELLSSSTIPLKPQQSQSSSTTLTSLESHLLLTPPGSSSRIDLLKSLDPTPEKISNFVGDSLTPDLLSLILLELDRNLVSSEEEEEDINCSWMVDLLRGLMSCKRFDTSRMLLSEEETGVVKRVLEVERNKLNGIEKGWGV